MAVLKLGEHVMNAVSNDRPLVPLVEVDVFPTFNTAGPRRTQPATIRESQYPPSSGDIPVPLYKDIAIVVSSALVPLLGTAIVK